MPLTDDDARAVLNFHFVGFFGHLARKEEAGYWVRIGGYLGSDIEAEGLESVSLESFEYAIRELAERTPRAVLVPLEDPQGLFVRLQRLRAQKGATFDPRNAPLKVDDCDRLDLLEQSLPALRARRRELVDWSLAGPGGFMVHVYAQAMLHRVLHLIDGTIATWNAGNGVAAAVLARGVLESVAVWDKATGMIEHHLKSEQFDDYDRLIARLFFGRKDTKQAPFSQDADAKRRAEAEGPINVDGAVRKLNDKQPGVYDLYGELSEVAHPNGEGVFAVSSWNDVSAVEYAATGAGLFLFGTIVAAIRVDLVTACLDRWEAIATRLKAIWERRTAQARNNSPR